MWTNRLLCNLICVALHQGKVVGSSIGSGEISPMLGYI